MITLLPNELLLTLARLTLPDYLSISTPSSRNLAAKRSAL
jgi:hypothetical protein